MATIDKSKIIRAGMWITVNGVDVGPTQNTKVTLKEEVDKTQYDQGLTAAKQHVVSRDFGCSFSILEQDFDVFQAITGFTIESDGEATPHRRMKISAAAGETPREPVEVKLTAISADDMEITILEGQIQLDVDMDVNAQSDRLFNVTVTATPDANGDLGYWSEVGYVTS
jgi:hypothetical protein